MTASQAFERYMDYLVNGSEELQEENLDDSADNPEWFLFRLEDGQLSTEQQKQYLAEAVPQETGLATDYLNAASSTLRAYLEATLSMTEIRIENNCYVNGVLNSTCSGGLYETNTTYASVDKQQNANWKTISRLIPRFDQLLQNKTKEMSILLKGANE